MTSSALRQYSAGGVVYRRTEQGQIDVVLIATRNGERWGLPKGWIEQDEAPEQAAIREVREETGLDARPVELLNTIEYWFRVQRDGTPVRVHKTVHFYLMEALGGNLADHDQEVDEVCWFPLDEAIAVATYDGERDVLVRARKIVSPAAPLTAGETE